VSVSLEQARAARLRLAAELASAQEVNGIGIVLHEGDYGLKVNLLEPVSLPTEVDGVSVSFDVVGPSLPA
jgi:hypothetical protein